ncbi:MAG: AAA family ATPase [Planctomycetota bacterium]|nr:AAA family ATPase [Planctomycetota bacterium]
MASEDRPAPGEREEAERFAETFAAIRAEIGRVIVGHDEAVRDTLVAIVAGGHVLIEGLPGLGKTLLVRTLAGALDLSFSRIQFTPDLMPADIVGTMVLHESPDGDRSLRFQKGPIFANLVLADEINRATPKTQSACLEAMQEGSVTVGGETRILDQPFFVMATQNPIEMEGTFPLPEAQLDRFLFKVPVFSPTIPELVEILDRTTGKETPRPKKLLDRSGILAMRDLARRVLVASHVKEYVARLIRATHPRNEEASPDVKRYVRYGASPRGAQAVLLAAKVLALAGGRANVAFEDIEAAFPNAIRHRLVLNFEAEAAGVDADRIVRGVLGHVRQPGGA